MSNISNATAINTSSYNNLQEWLTQVSKNNENPTLIHFIGSIGVGKKTYIEQITKELNYKCIHINCLYDKDHTYFKKKNFVTSLKHIVTNRNIEFLISGMKDIVIIHNLHIMHEKSFFDQLLKLKKEVKFVTPVICILNSNYISERFLTYITKDCIVFKQNPKSHNDLLDILTDAVKQYNMSTIPNELIESINQCKGNIYSILTKAKQYSFTKNFITNENSKSNHFDKHIVSKCFTELCSKNIHLRRKYEIIKAQGSLIRLLMPNHVFQGLDINEKLNFNEKINLSIKCMNYLSKGDKLSVTNNAYAALLQCIYPTTMIQEVTVKNMVLSNYHSSNVLCLSQILYPHPADQYVYILHYIINAIELEQCRKKYKDQTEWSTWLPCLDRKGLNELQHKYLKLFPNSSITKKKINRFLNRLVGAIPD